MSQIPPLYCGHCGQPLVVQDPAADHPVDHPTCRTHLALEPPRFCTRCRRRMKVQVTPRGWTATCVEHGDRRHDEDPY